MLYCDLLITEYDIHLSNHINDKRVCLFGTPKCMVNESLFYVYQNLEDQVVPNIK